MKRFTISEAEARQILGQGELLERMCTSAPSVAIILTQSWCPQWRDMDAYLMDWEGEEPDPSAIHVHHLLYDLLPVFPSFLQWKEETFLNYDIPYVRFYHKGNFVGDSNYIPLSQFKANLLGTA